VSAPSPFPPSIAAVTWAAPGLRGRIVGVRAGHHASRAAASATVRSSARRVPGCARWHDARAAEQTERGFDANQTIHARGTRSSHRSRSRLPPAPRFPRRCAGAGAGPRGNLRSSGVRILRLPAATLSHRGMRRSKVRPLAQVRLAEDHDARARAADTASCWRAANRRVADQRGDAGALIPRQRRT